MSSTYLITELERQREELEKALENLKEQKTKIDREYFSLKKEEDKIYEKIRQCRDNYQFDSLQMRLNVVATQRKSIERKRSEIEKKIRGYENEIEKIKQRINYLKPSR